jgi:lipopolysaccharide/colanic/teichoic acid biosynthesis glycosyltransferase
MVQNADEILQEHLDAHPEYALEWRLHHKLRNDPRVTRVGWFLRRTSLDELPQLWNVLRGDMSMVGPRPIVEEEVPKYGAAYALYSEVTPGLTGLWQVSGRNDVSYRRRIELDTDYIRR